ALPQLPANRFFNNNSVGHCSEAMETRASANSRIAQRAGNSGKATGPKFPERPSAFIDRIPERTLWLKSRSNVLALSCAAIGATLWRLVTATFIIRNRESNAMEDLTGLVKGLHHITLVTSNEETNRRFYTEVLGLRRVKLTVNQDDIYHRHLFYADERGTTGSAITFFEWPGLPHGETGTGSPHHLSYSVPKLDAIWKWRSWLVSKGVSVAGPLVRQGRVSLYLKDPDGVNVELAHPNEGAISQEYAEEESKRAPEVSEITHDMPLGTFNHASPISSDQGLTAKYLKMLVGLRDSTVMPNPDDSNSSVLEMGNEDRPDFLRYISAPNASYGSVGIGNIHHIAMAVEEDEDQLRIKRRLDEASIANSGIVDRFWFKSLYFRDPDGNLLEIATVKPGYTADETPERLGTGLVLPAWLEPKRSEIQDALNKVDRSNTKIWPPSYPATEISPERIGVNQVSGAH
ncbi:MAG: VOC family protein, partial [Thaumarchaeota archaeon]|nr:VOC family protein [Nitrososphaerota archaeon]